MFLRRDFFHIVLLNFRIAHVFGSRVWDESSWENISSLWFVLDYPRCGHTTDQCSALKELLKNNKKKRSKYDKKSNRKSEKTYTRHEVNALVEKKIKKALHGKKKKRRHDELHEFENLDISDGEKTAASANSSSSISSSSSDSE